MPKKFTTEEKAQILARVAAIGAAAAAKEAGVSYNSILKWMKKSKESVTKPENRCPLVRLPPKCSI